MRNLIYYEKQEFTKSLTEEICNILNHYEVELNDYQIFRINEDLKDCIFNYIDEISED